MERVVVVGAGLAGAQTAIALRRVGFAGELVMLGAERHPPYDRPPLSKAVLLAEPDADPGPEVALQFDATALGVDLRLATPAAGLRDGTVETAAGDVLYDTLVVATGAEPVRLPGEGARYLRTRDDAVELRARLVPGAAVVVCGAGWIGAEVATAAGRHGARVTVVEQGETPVGNVLPPEVARHFRPWYARAGVELLTGARVRETRPDGVSLDDGRELAADVVVVGVGVRARTSWLAGSGLAVDGGVVVGPGLRTDRAGVLAVGDVAARWSPRYGARIRGEHWDDALRAPAVVAANIVGGADRYDPVPYVWSEQFGHRVQFAGRYRSGDRAVWRGDPDRDPAWSVCWLGADGAIVAILAVDRPRDLVQGRRLAERATPVDPDRLADPGIAVRSCALG